MRTIFLTLVINRRNQFTNQLKNQLTNDIILTKFRDFLQTINVEINGFLDKFDDPIIMAQPDLRTSTFFDLQKYLIDLKEKAKELVNSQFGNQPIEI